MRLNSNTQILHYFNDRIPIIQNFMLISCEFMLIVILTQAYDAKWFYNAQTNQQHCDYEPNTMNFPI